MRSMLSARFVQRLRTCGLAGIADFGLLVALAAVAIVAGFRSAILHPAESKNAAPPLDCFSPPSLALAVLNREVNRLLMNYGQLDRHAVPVRPIASDDSRISQPPARSVGDTFIGPLAEFQAQLHDFQLQLGCRLLWLYSENGNTDDFLNCYLNLLAERPASSDVELWLPQALSFAQKGRRTAELVDAFKHLIEFHGNQPRIKLLGELLVKKRLLPAHPPKSTP